MRCETLTCNIQGSGHVDLSLYQEPAPDLILGFLPANDRLQDTLDYLVQQFPDSLIAGCTAEQQFWKTGLINSGSLQLYWFKQKGHGTWCEVIQQTSEGGIDTAGVLQHLEDERPDSALLLVDGVHFPVHQLLEELRTHADGDAPVIVGGLASKSLDPTHFYDDNGAWVFSGNRIHHGNALLIGLCGVELTTSIVRGWEPASPVYEVTDAEGTELRCIEDQSAADWYRDYFTVEGKLADLPDAAYGFPLIIDGPDPERRGIYRTMVVFDEPPGCVSFAGDLHTGDRIRLGIGNAESLVRAAQQLNPAQAEACLLFSCAAREAVLGDAAGDEIMALQQRLGDLPFTGFFTFGEIGPAAKGTIAYYNQTGVLARLREKDDEDHA